MRRTRPRAAMPATPSGSTRSKPVLTEIGPVPLEVPRDRQGPFEPKLVRSASGACQALMRWCGR